jgi:ABC-type glycerol-3-phosphate transport system substrate-binding protein
MQKTSVVFGLLVVIALVVMACGGGTSSTTGAPGTTVAPPTTAGTGSTQPGEGSAGGATGVSLPDLSGQTVEVAAVWSGTEQANFQKILDEFQKLTNASVTFTSTGDDIATVLGTRIQGGNPPDVAILPQPGLMASLVTQGVLQPIGDLVASSMSQNYAPVWKDLGMVNDQQYGLVFKAANKSIIWYNVAAFQQAGVEPPQTWDDLLTRAQTLSNSGVVPFSIGGADGWTLTDWFENVYLQTAGPDMYDQLTKHEIPWTDASVTKALETLAQVFGKSEWIAGGNSGALQVDFPTSVTQVFASPPKAAMVYEGDFAASNITGSTDAKLGTDANFFPFPSIGGAKTSVVAGGDTAVLMKDSDGGKALMQFLASPQAAEIWVKLGGFISPNKSVAESSYPDPTLAKAATSLANAEVVRFDMSDLTPPAFGGTPAKGEWKDLQDFLRNPSDIQGTQQKLESDAAAAYQ